MALLTKFHFADCSEQTSYQGLPPSARAQDTGKAKTACIIQQ